MESKDCVRDVLLNMKKQERADYKRNINVPSELQEIFEPLWRRKILEWMYSLVDNGMTPRETVAVASYFIDVSVSKGLVKSKRGYQLVATTALHISKKLYDSTVVNVEDLIKLCRNLFSEEDIIQMERRIMCALDWKLHPPTAECFLQQQLLLFPSILSYNTRETLEKASQLIFEKAAFEERFAKCYLPSTLSYAAIMISMDLISDRDLPIWQKQCFVMNMMTHAGMKSSSKELRQVILELKLENGLEARLISSIGSQTRGTILGKRSRSLRGNSQSDRSPVDPIHAGQIQ